MKFNQGDIICFREVHFSHYDTGPYIHKVGYHYLVVNISDRWLNKSSILTGMIRNLVDDSEHFIFGDAFDKLVLLSEFRDSQLSHLGI